jgi:hypothetical protein
MYKSIIIFKANGFLMKDIRQQYILSSGYENLPAKNP